jgi:hypothetical protein
MMATNLQALAKDAQYVADTHFNMAGIYLYLGRHAEAERHLRHLLLIDPAHAPGRQQLNLALAGQGKSSGETRHDGEAGGAAPGSDSGPPFLAAPTAGAPTPVGRKHSQAEAALRGSRGWPPATDPCAPVPVRDLKDADLLRSRKASHSREVSQAAPGREGVPRDHGPSTSLTRTGKR